MKILIVDDSPITRSMLRDMFEIAGHEIAAEAETLAGAVESYRAHKPDLTTLDLSLVGTNGLEILKALRELDPRARVMIVSGNAQKRVLEAARAAGAEGFLPKPFNVDELTAALKAMGPPA
ncbi:MAG TPA: response regulator [Elusimicrobiota bacterium]|jgi:two-component system chemotaxis response regulator CheY|nr:response regulator [Elusimicrobiota bacterium]